SHQQCYARFQKMKPPQFQGGKSEDAHEFLTLCHEMVETSFRGPFHSLEHEREESSEIGDLGLGKSVCDRTHSIPHRSYLVTPARDSMPLARSRACMPVPIYVSRPVGESLVVDRVYRSWLVFVVGAHRLVDRGCLSYLSFFRDTSVEPPCIDHMPMVREFKDVFHTDLLGVLLDRDIDFAIDLEPSTKPISIPSYPMASTELTKLKD
ncbi:hypothetical protein MTR67_003362, partial [Solanum verrucosum]